MLSHPLIVEAAETWFEPLCIYNNTKGDHDAKVRAAFEEPSWNNPVVRILDRAGEDLTQKLTRRWSVAGMADLMVRALRAADRTPPTWLALLAATSDVAADRVESAIFGMG